MFWVCSDPLRKIKIWGHCVPSLIPFVIGHGSWIIQWQLVILPQASKFISSTSQTSQGSNLLRSCWSVHTYTDTAVKTWGQLCKFLCQLKFVQIPWGGKNTTALLGDDFCDQFLKDFSWTLFFWIWKFLLPNSITMLTTTFEGLTIPQGPPWIQWKTFRLTWFFDKMHFIGHIFWCIVFLFPLLNHPTFGSDAHIWKILNYFNWSWDIFN